MIFYVIFWGILKLILDLIPINTSNLCLPAILTTDNNLLEDQIEVKIERAKVSRWRNWSKVRLILKGLILTTVAESLSLPNIGLVLSDKPLHESMGCLKVCFLTENNFACFLLFFPVFAIFLFPSTSKEYKRTTFVNRFQRRVLWNQKLRNNIFEKK